MKLLRTGGSAILLSVVIVATAWAADGPPPGATVSTDVYYKTEGVVSGPPAPRLDTTDYPAPNLPSVFGESRLLVWSFAQQHLYFGGLVLGLLFLALIFELKGALGRRDENRQRYDRLARSLLQFTVLALSVAALFGGVLLFALLSLYPGLTAYLARIFNSSFLGYGVLFLVLSGMVYLYHYTWGSMGSGPLKGLHLGIGLLANVLATVMMFLANSWGTFMMSPAGVDDLGRFLGNNWHTVHNALWNPLNVHRFFGNLVFSAGVIMVYFAYSAITARSRDDRTHYDWMSFMLFFAAVLALFTIPYGGYWLSREIFGYRQQMGITIFGGLLAWFNVVLLILMGFLFLSINYYIWQRIDDAGRVQHYRRHVKYVFFVLAVAFLICITPHTLVVTVEELAAMGGQQHPVVGNFGVESAKNSAVNIMILVTIWSLLVMWKSRYPFEQAGRAWSDAVLLGLFLIGALNIIGLGIYGYYVPANVRVGLSVPMVLTTMSAGLIGTVMTFVVTRRRTPITLAVWGTLSARGYYALLFIAATASWIMGLGGYMRSSLRLNWHVTEIFQDTSPWAFTHPMGFVAAVITVNVLVFWGGVGTMMWLARK